MFLGILLFACFFGTGDARQVGTFPQLSSDHPGANSPPPLHLMNVSDLTGKRITIESKVQTHGYLYRMLSALGKVWQS